MFVGIEIGGTKLQLGVGPGDGTLIALERAKVDGAAGAERIRQQITRLVPRLLAHAALSKGDIRAAGIGFGGPVDAERGVITKSHQIEGWAGFPLADWCRRELGWPTVVHNDADTAGLAEACFGAGRGYSPIFYVTIGSGIGGGLIIDQTIYRGAGAGAAEIGHLRIPAAGEWGCLEFDPHGRVPDTVSVESLCSGWSIAARTTEMIKSIRKSENKIVGEQRVPWDQRDAQQLVDLAGGQVDSITADVVAGAARQGNRLAAVVLSACCSRLGWAIAQVVTLLCPRRVVIGGGVSLIGEDLLLRPLREAVARYVFPPFADSYDIVPAALGEAVVVHGALRLAAESATGQVR